MNKKQLEKLQEIARKTCGYSDPMVEVTMEDEEVYQFACDDFKELKYPNQIKRGLRYV